MKPIRENNKASCSGELTIEKLKTYKGFEHLTDEQAEKELQTINSLIRVLYGIYVEESRKNKTD